MGISQEPELPRPAASAHLGEQQPSGYRNDLQARQAERRRRAPSASVKDLCEKRRVALISVEESLDTASAAGGLVITIMAAVSQWQREAIDERTRDALRHKRTSGGRMGNIRFGFRLTQDRKHVEPDPGEQGVLTEVRHLRRAATRRDQLRPR